MDSDKQSKENKPRSYNSSITNGSNVLQSIRIRYPFLFSDETNIFLLDYNISFLPGISILLYAVFFLA